MNHINEFMWFVIGDNISLLLLRWRGVKEVRLRRRPRKAARMGIDLNSGVRIGSWFGKIIVQFINLPAIIDIIVKFSAGIVVSLSVLLIWCKGEHRNGDQVTEIRNRIEYAEVKDVAIKKIKKIKMFLGLKVIISIIRSLE